MFNRLYLLNYNNYFNRLIKQEPTLNDYVPYIVASLEATNFNPNDHITTSHIVNVDDTIAPDYAIVTNDKNEIVSRWFVLESTRVRGGQYSLSLYRDTVVDYYNVIIDAPCFIEKATLADTDPLIFNQEDFRVNQIKTSETLLKDMSDCAWLVGYLDAGQTIEDISVSNEVGLNTTDIGELATWKYYLYSNLALNQEKYKNDFKKRELTIHFHNHASNKYYVCDLNLNTGKYNTGETGAYYANVCVEYNSNTYGEGIFIRDYMARVMTDLTITLQRNRFLPDYVGDITEYDGKLVKDEDDKVYLATVNPLSATSVSYGDIGATSAIGVVLNSIATELSGIENTKVNPRYAMSYTRYNITLDEQSQYSTTFTLNPSSYTEDIYRIICIPFPDEGKIFRLKNTSSGDIDITRNKAINIARAICKKGGSIVYDFQLLPYCPLANDFEGIIEYRYIGDQNPVHGLDLNNQTEADGHYTLIGSLGAVLEVRQPTFTFNIYHPIPVNEVKVENQCDMWRLCSPNYSAVFEFSAAKNGGVRYFNVDCRYKPYQPYIHINPNFGGLYGQDFNDPRGLILSGDFSISRTDEAFTTYELTNKNYQLIFDRQIQNIEIQNKYQRIGEWAGIIGGGLQGGVTGAGMASMLGAGKGSIGVGIGTGIASTGLGVVDYFINEQLRKENLDYTKDQFGYNLANIQAQPDTLTKVSAFNPNNKIYPVLEYYTCTDREKEAFENKLKYNGMSVGVIGKISDYLLAEPSYIKGQIIRLENLNEETHVANIIAQEIFKGVFI